MRGHWYTVYSSLTAGGALATRVSAETGLALDPEYTGVFRWQRRGAIVYWWDWCLPA